MEKDFDFFFQTKPFSPCSWYGDFWSTTTLRQPLQSPKTHRDGNDPSGCCSETAKKKKQTKKPQRVQFGFCVLWRLKLLKKKKKEEKKAPQCSKNSLAASPLFEHKTEISLVFLIILVARCYCRFKDLFLDGRSGG